MNKISSSQFSSQYTYLCSDCNDIPSIQLIDSEQRHVRIHCKTCNTYHNILIEEFIRKIVKEQRYGYYCNSNPKHNKIYADTICLTCNIIMCGNCIESHKKKYKAHVLSKSIIERFYKCNRHLKNDIKFYCMECELYFCDNCITKHIKHRYNLLWIEKMKCNVEDFSL